MAKKMAGILKNQISINNIHLNRISNCFILLRGIRAFIFLLLILLSSSPITVAQTTEDCLDCHEDNQLTKERDGREISLYIDLDRYRKSVHTDLECIDCHSDLDGAELPHDENLERVDCGNCHDDVADIYLNSLHGQAVQRGEKMAPSCSSCHGKHDILSSSSPDSPTDHFNIPFMCGRCHKEGTAVSETYDIPQDSILTHYSESIHGIGLFQQGLTVTAVCVDCHTAHNVRAHTDSQSSIFRDNVPITCQKCHGRIEEVHKKVIRGELWEKEPHKVPVCVDCHEPHKARKVFYELGMSDRDCLLCHAKPDLTALRNGETVSMSVDSLELHDSKHRGVACAQCHTGVSPEHARPCATVALKVDCSICHSEVVDEYDSSMHGQLVLRGDQNAPECTDCHGRHNIRGRRDPLSPSYPINVPDLCGKCHREGSKAAEKYTGETHNILANYVMSIHGKGLLSSGLIVTAMCTDCHTAHHVLPKIDPASSVNRANIPQTCANCHKGIYEQYIQSIHSPEVSDSDKPLPTCSDCHQSHTISRTDEEDFKLDIVEQCGYCHEDVTESYFETFHGKVSKLGYTEAAKCYDCHGAHKVLPTYDPNSTLSRQNIVATCGKCHEGSHRQFAGYLTHATHHDRKKYPILYYTFWFMTILLLGTLFIAGIHTVLWLPRSIQALRNHRKLHKKATKFLEFQRFTRLQRRMHFMVIISFLGLAVTGMTLKFSYLGWAQWISQILGGFASAGFIHRICAIITFTYFGMHIFDVIRRKRRSGKSWKTFLFDSNSMLPNKYDWIELKGSLKWFIGLGPRPKYGRWTYWEKFDYFAVFWGVAIIGTTGLILWFPEFFTHFLPGWMINVATIVHSDEALLAVAFIFTIHFFNTHMRPDKFPMDTVIFTRRISLEEFREDRPREYAELVKNKQLRKHLVEPMAPKAIRTMKIFGSIALIIGLSLILLIVYAEIFGYR